MDVIDADETTPLGEAVQAPGVISPSYTTKKTKKKLLPKPIGQFDFQGEEYPQSASDSARVKSLQEKLKEIRAHKGLSTPRVLPTGLISPGV